MLQIRNLFLIFMVSVFCAIPNAWAENIDVDNRGHAQQIVEKSDIDVDVLENHNRRTFAFNQYFDRVLLKPIAQGYDYVMPGVGRLLVQNILDYISLPWTIINAGLQGDIQALEHSIVRFALNTTLGGLGLLDPATEMGFRRHSEDFGQTLAVYGIGEGLYWVAPFLGPTTPRDIVGRVVDSLANPVFHISGMDNIEVSAGNTAGKLLEFRAKNIDIIENLENSSSDFYVVTRNVFRQSRQAAIENRDLQDQAGEGIDIDFGEE